MPNNTLHHPERVENIKSPRPAKAIEKVRKLKCHAYNVQFYA